MRSLPEWVSGYGMSPLTIALDAVLMRRRHSLFDPCFSGVRHAKARPRLFLRLVAAGCVRGWRQAFHIAFWAGIVPGGPRAGAAAMRGEISRVLFSSPSQCGQGTGASRASSTTSLSCPVAGLDGFDILADVKRLARALECSGTTAAACGNCGAVLAAGRGAGGLGVARRGCIRHPVRAFRTGAESRTGTRLTGSSLGNRSGGK